MNGRKFINKIMIGLWLTCVMALVHAGTPLWTFSAPNPATVSVSEGGTASVQYTVTNQSRKSKRLILNPYQD